MLTTFHPPPTSSLITTLTPSTKSACVPSASWRTNDAPSTKAQSGLEIVMTSTSWSWSVSSANTSVPANGPGCSASICTCADCSPSVNTRGPSVVSCAPAARANTNVNMNAAPTRLIRTLLCTPHPLCLLWTTVFYTREGVQVYPKKAVSST